MCGVRWIDLSVVDIYYDDLGDVELSRTIVYTVNMMGKQCISISPRRARAIIVVEFIVPRKVCNATRLFVLSSFLFIN